MLVDLKRSGKLVIWRFQKIKLYKICWENYVATHRTETGDLYNNLVTTTTTYTSHKILQLEKLAEGQIRIWAWQIAIILLRQTKNANWTQKRCCVVLFVLVPKRKECIIKNRTTYAHMLGLNYFTKNTVMNHLTTWKFCQHSVFKDMRTIVPYILVHVCLKHG